MTVVDPQGREWSVKQPYPSGLDDEGPAEVVLSRVGGRVSAATRLLPAHLHAEGRLGRPHGDWRPVPAQGRGPQRRRPVAVGRESVRRHQAVSRAARAADDVQQHGPEEQQQHAYERRNGDRTERWYVVRDIGSALGDTNGIAARKNHAESFERHPFILGVSNGYVEFKSHGWYRPLVEERITPDDVVWASTLLSRLTDRQVARRISRRGA